MRAAEALPAVVGALPTGRPESGKAKGGQWQMLGSFANPGPTARHLPNLYHTQHITYISRTRYVEYGSRVQMPNSRPEGSLKGCAST